MGVLTVQLKTIISWKQPISFIWLHLFTFAFVFQCATFYWKKTTELRLKLILLQLYRNLVNILISFLLQGKFTTKSDVWSFGVALWEILTFARDQPYDTMNDEQVIENAGHYYRHDNQQIYLPQPANCPKEIYDLKIECWNRAEAERPSFREIQMFLQRKNMGYNPKDEKMNQIKVPIC